MNSVNYLPVNFKRNNAYMLTPSGKISVEDLKRIYNVITDKAKYSDIKLISGTIVLNERIIRLVDVIAAMKYAEVANQSDFTFYELTSNSGLTYLLISGKYGDTSIAVNPYTLETYMLTGDAMLFINNFIDKKLDDAICVHVTNIIKAVSTGKLCNCLFIDRKSKTDAQFIVSPIYSPTPGAFYPYTLDELEELRTIGSVNETETYYLDGVYIRHKNLASYKLKLTQANKILKLYKDCLDTKSNYMTLSADDTNMSTLFVSTDFNHVVNGDTFKQYFVGSNNLKLLLQQYVVMPSIPIALYNNVVSMLESGEHSEKD